MDADLIDLSQIQNEEGAKSVAQMFSEGMYENQKFCKQFCIKVLSNIYDMIVSKPNVPASKFYTLLILRDLILKKDTKFIGVLNASTLMEQIQKIAIQTDPKKKMSQKGLKMFPNDQGGVNGNNFMQILLEMTVYLGRNFSKGHSGPTKFKRVLTKIQDKVILPKEFKYFPDKNKMSSSTTKPTQKPPQKPKPKKESDNFKSLVGFVDFKIEEYVEKLQDEEDGEVLEQLIMQKHKIFEGEIEKFAEFGDSIYKNQPKVIQQFEKIQEFLFQETNAYNQFIPKNDIKSYLDEINILYERIFENQNPTPGNPSTKPQPKHEQPKHEKPKSAVNKPIQANKLNPSQSKPVQIKKQPPKSSIEKPKPQVQHPNNPLSNSIAMKSIFDQLQSRSKPPNVGFKMIKKSLQKEKSMIHAHPPRNKNEGARVLASTLTKNALKISSIFKNPPNIAPPYKNYEGQIVLSSKDLQKVLYNIKREQTHRRFQIANFRNRNPLFENDSLQIGYKSEAIFEPNDDGFNQVLALELYFGNKTSHQLRNFELVFQGDENTLVYTNPRDFPSYIEAQQQIRYQMMVVPFKIPYGFITLKLMYQTVSEVIHTTIALPNSILKMSWFIEIDRVQQQQIQQLSTVKLKSEYFRLSQNFPPNSLKKYIPQLNESTSYSEFSLQGSTTDYELYCLVEIMKDYEANLKIIIRPDLHVVIQMGLMEPSEDGLRYSKFFLQSLQLVLQDNGR